MPDENTPSANSEEEPKAAEEGSVPVSQYKNLQRELEKQRRRNSEQASRIWGLESLIPSVKRIEEGLTKTAAALSKAEVLDEAKEEFASVAKGLEEQGKSDKEAFSNYQALTELLEESDVDWSDPRLEQAKGAYSAGNTSEALKLARNALTPESESLETIVTARVQEALKKLGKVDTAESTAAGQSSFPSDPDKLAELVDNPEWWSKNKDRLMAAVRGGQVKLR